MKPTVTAMERDLRSLLKGDVEFDAITRHLYATDGGIYQIEPVGVVSPRDAEDVAKLVAYATENGVPLVARGSGSGLAGAAVGAGLQVDFTRYMNRILEMAPDGSWARIQPGLVMGVLNQEAKRYGTFFAPNPSSENYASLGGMMANNASGSRSVAYGGTKDHVLSTDVVLSGGEIFKAGRVGRRGQELAAFLNGSSVAARAYSRIIPLLEEKQAAISASMPRVMKNASGYRVETILDGDNVNLHKIFISSEGTLGLITEATLNLVPLPGRRAIAMAYFPTVFAAGEAVFPILGLKPTSLEIMDSSFLNFVRKSKPAIDAMLPANVNTALLVEFEADDDAELAERLAALETLLAGGPVLEVKRALAAAEQAQLWAIRKAAVPLLQKLPGPKRIAEFIEDVTVHPDQLASYMSTLAGILKSHGVDAIMYGHAGDGNIHTRPVLNLKDSGDLALMQTIMDEVMDYVLSIKGTPSGEHGDGLSRSPYVEKVYGKEIYGVFKEIKAAFDPSGIMNPGKKIVSKAEGGGVATNLRYGADYWTYDQPTLLYFPDDEFQREIEKCHGCAECKSLVGTSMCPTFKSTRREHASPRAKANLLRNVIQGKLPPYDLYVTDAMHTVTDYCIECGMCAVECPSNVNIPKLMLEAKSKFREGRRATPVDMVLSRAELVSKAAHIAAPIANPLVNQPFLRSLGEKIIGVDKRRTLPHFASRKFTDTVAKRAKNAGEAYPGAVPATQTVAFFLEVFANYNDPALADTMDRLLRAHGVDVVYPEQRASGILEMAYGYATRAKEVAAFNVSQTLPYVQRGCLLVSGEPTASFAFKEHYKDYLEGEDCRLVGRWTRDLGEFLADYRKQHPELALKPSELPLKVAYHQPCHLKVQQVGTPFLDLMREVPGLQITNLDSGCCGMAGTYGMKAGTFDLSMQTGRPLLDKVKEVAPQLVLSECSSCRMQINQATGYPTEHPAQLLARVYGL